MTKIAAASQQPKRKYEQIIMLALICIGIAATAFFAATFLEYATGVSSFGISLWVVAVVTFWLGWLFACVGTVLVIAKRRRTKGILLGILVITLGIGAIGLCYVNSVHNKAFVDDFGCRQSLYSLKVALEIHALQNDGCLPESARWCDKITDRVVEERALLCRASGAERCSYAMNKFVAGRKLQDIPEDVVILFDASDGWNQTGGAEMFNPENHRGRGCCILFGQGRIEFVKTRDLDKLKWEMELEPNSP